MSTADHQRCPTLIQRSFLHGGVSPADFEAMRRHVRECESCERLYERYAQAEAALHVGSTGKATNAGQLDRVAGRLFDPAPATRRGNRPVWAGLSAFAAATAALVIAVAVPGPEAGPGPRPGSGDELRSRSGSSAQVAPDLGLRVLRARADGPSVDVRDVTAVGSVRVGDRVAILVTNLANAAQVQIDLMGSDGVIETLVASQPIASDVEDERVGTLAVDDDWPSGPVVLRARFQLEGGKTETREVTVEVERP